jgi:SAM-dependent methyltransferase
MNESSYRYERAIRSHPKIWQPGYLIHRIIHREVSAFACFTEKENGGRVLDFGCGKTPFRDLFASYVGADLDDDGKEPDLMVDPETNRITGADDRSFSNVISIQVIEHVPKLEKYILEATRVLKPGGYLFIMAPFLYNFHGSDDYARYTRNFFTTGPMFKDFTIVSLHAESNDFIVFLAYQINHFFELFPLLKFAYPLFLPINIAALMLSTMTRALFEALGRVSPKFMDLYRSTFLLYPLQIAVTFRKRL